MSTIEILEMLEADNSRLYKEKILFDNRGNETLRRALIMAADPWKNWGVVKYDKPSSNGAVHDDAALVSFMDLLDLLNDRKLTGNKARGAVEGAISVFDEIGQKWTERLLWRNLRCGVSATTINKVWPGSIVPFGVALAESLTTQGVNGDFKIVDPIKYPIRVEAKLDGLRCVAVKSKGEVTLYTRSGTVLETMPKIKAAIEALGSDNFVLDGEAMGEDWNESASVLMSSKTKKDDSGIRYHVFDCVPLPDWQDQKTDLTYEARLADLVAIIGAGPMISQGPFRYVKAKDCSSEDELRSFYASCLDEGYEGVMLKDVKAKYQWKRSSAILKLKPVSTEEGVVVGWHLSPEKTKRAGLFGGFHVLTPNGIVTKVGGGYTDALKKQIQDEGPDTYIGRVAEVEHQPPFTADGKLRFPVFSRFRSSADVDQKVIDAYDAWKLKNT